MVVEYRHKTRLEQIECGPVIIFMRYFILSVFLFGTMSFPFSGSAEQVLADEFHYMPILIQIPHPDKNTTSYGTGIFLEESNRVFFVTAAHIIFNLKSTNIFELNDTTAILSGFIIKKDSTEKSIVTLNLKQLLDSGLLKRHSTHDVAVIQIATGELIGTNGMYVFHFSNGVLPGNLSSDKMFAIFKADATCRLFNDISDGRETYIFGYPVELLNNNIPSEVDFNYPLIRKGIISQRNQQTRKLIIDSGVYGGNSGGPIVIIEHPGLGTTVYKVGGLITQFVPFLTRMNPQIGVTNSDLVNSGYGVAEPIDYALELMRQ